MNKRVLLGALLMLTTVGTSALADRISIKGNSQDAVQGKCDLEAGDAFWPKTGKDTTYGCLHADGTGIVCGGKTKQDKSTCDTFMQVPKRLIHDLGTRVRHR